MTDNLFMAQARQTDNISGKDLGNVPSPSAENNQSQESRLVSTEKFSSFSNPGSNPGPDALRGIFDTSIDYKRYCRNCKKLTYCEFNLSCPNPSHKLIVKDKSPFDAADLEKEILEEFRRRTQRKGFYLYKIGKSLVLSEEDFDVLLDIFKETSQRLKAEVEKILDDYHGEVFDRIKKRLFGK